MINNVMILGTLPPPVGGVTIHVKRLLKELENENISVHFIDIRPLKKWRYALNVLKVLLSKEKVVHYQLNNWKESAILSQLLRVKRVKFISTIHSFPVNYCNLPIFIKVAIKITAKGTWCFVAPSDVIYRQLISAGIKADKIKVLHTFISPTQEEMDEEIPKDIIEFMKGTEKIIVANASKLYLNDLDEDVYGLDLCIELCARINTIKLIFVCPSIGDIKYYQQCISKIDELGISKRFLFYNKKISLVSLFKKVQLFVRPTVSDSYGISVAEALSMGIPVVASDVCARAEGTILYRKGDLDDLMQNVQNVLNDDEQPCRKSIPKINYRSDLYGL